MQPSIEQYSAEVQESQRFMQPPAREASKVDTNSSEPYIDVMLTNVEDSMIVDLSQCEVDAPAQREHRKKISFFTNASTHTRNLQKTISSQASNLRTKVRRGLKTVNSYSQRASGSNLKANLKSTTRTSQPSPKERKKFKDISFANKLRAIHMPKMPKAELYKFTDRIRMMQTNRRPSSNVTNATTTITTMSAIEKSGGSDMDTIALHQNEPLESKSATLNRFDYPKIFTRFKAPPKAEEMPESSDYDASVHRPSFSSFSSHFATVPRTASRLKKSIKSKLSKTYNKTTARNGSGSKLN